MVHAEVDAVSADHLGHGHAPGHAVVFYDDESHLASRVRDHVLDGLQQGEGVLLVQQGPRWDRLVADLEEADQDVDALLDTGRLLHKDAAALLQDIFVDGTIRREPFEAHLLPAWTTVSAGGSRPVRAVGELVDLLWTAEEYAAALSLEDLWETFLDDREAHLLCTYPASLVDEPLEHVEAVVTVHDGAVDVPGRSRLDAAMLRAMDEVFGPERAHEIRRRIEAEQGARHLGTTEQVVFWVRRHLARHADELMERAKVHFAAVPV